MTKKQINELKTLFFLVRAYINEQDVEDADNIFTDIEKQISYISNWINK